MSDKNICQKVRERIERYDRLIGMFGMEILKVDFGYAEVAMVVKPEHLNAADFCHGGAMFSLADVAFALAANSHGGLAVGLEVSANYMRPVKAGERVVAVAEERHRGKHTGVYLISMRNGDGKEVAFVKATAFRVQDTYPPPSANGHA
ncbi:MAG: hotdog fold thioesterase [Dissulfuribacterales bacterium]